MEINIVRLRIAFLSESINLSPDGGHTPQANGRAMNLNFLATLYQAELVIWAIGTDWAGHNLTILDVHCLVFVDGISIP